MVWLSLQFVTKCTKVFSTNQKIKQASLKKTATRGVAVICARYFLLLGEKCLDSLKFGFEVIDFFRLSL